jgi:transcriptional regulator EpsA
MHWTGQTRRGFNQGALVAAMQSLDSVCSKEAFITWTQTDFHRALAHGAFMACVGKVHEQGVRPIEVVSANFPDECSALSARSDNRCSTFLMQSWLQSGQPQLFDPSQPVQGMRPPCPRVFKERGPHNAVAHGLFDVNRDHVSFFSFHHLPYPPRAEQATLLRLIVPGMHAALLRCIQAQAGSPGSPLPALTSRETEVLTWICQGKTNSEIASILCISPHTVKNQTQNILVKLRVNTRAQAAAQAMRQRLVSWH